MGRYGNKFLLAVVLVLCRPSAGHGDQAGPADLSGIAANRFVELPNPSPVKPDWSAPVYAADSGVLLAIAQADRNSDPQLLSFDFAGGAWKPEGRAECGPAPGVYDSTRKRVVFGGQWAYDPAAGSWTRLEAVTELYGKTYPGAPDVRNANMCYDPENDEMVLFPCQGLLNWDEWPQTGRLKGHLGTLSYSFKDHTWRRLAPGSEPIRKARQGVHALYVRQWRLTERLAVLRRDSYAQGIERVKPAIVELSVDQAVLAGDARKLADELAGLETTDAHEAGQVAAAVKALLEAAEGMTLAAKELGAGTIAPAVNRGDLFRALERVRDDALAVEPSARAESPMVYDPKHKVIVLFGGYVGNQSANDTWIYQCEKRRWVRRTPEQSPPPRFYHFMFRHPHSGLIVMGGGKWAIPGGGGAGTSFRSLRDVWTYDVSENRWQRVEGTVPEISVGYMYGLHYANAAYADKQDVLILTTTRPAVHAFRFRPGPVLPALPLAEAVYPSRNDQFAYDQGPEVRVELPDDAPEALGRLSELPINTWVQPPVRGTAQRREWCIMSRDATRGYAVYFGGGHSTHMGDEIDVFSPGALAWTPSHRACNTQIAPSGGWPNHMPQFNGGPSVTHTRDQYTAMDGVFLLSEDYRIGRFYYGPDEILHYVEQTRRWRDKDYLRGKLSLLFRYDLEGARAWTAGLIPTQTRHLMPMMAFPALGKFGALRREGNAWTWATIARDTFDGQVVPVPDPVPDVDLMEGQHAGALAERGQIMLLGTGRQSKAVETWTYDIAANAWRRLEPRRSIPGPLVRCRAVVYCHDQEVVLASVTLQDKEAAGHWAYSFQRNTWAPFPAAQAEGLRVRDHGGPCWSQLVYLPGHKVFVWGAGPALLRPDFSRVRWGD